MEERDYIQRPDAKGHLKVLETLREWDPIGIICDDNQDEYDSYAPAIVRMLDFKPDAAMLANHLGKIQIEHLEMPDLESARLRELKLAEQLVDWWKEWKGA